MRRNTCFQNEAIERKIDMRQFRRIIRFVITYRSTIALVCVLMLISAVAAVDSQQERSR